MVAGKSQKFIHLYITSMDKKRAVIYARTSTTDQTCLNQTLDLERFIAARGWHLEATFIDKGQSGVKENRPSYNQMLDMAKKKQFDILVCWSLSRLSRSLRQLISTLETFMTLNISLVSYTESIDCTTPAGKLFFAVIAAISEFERSVLIERVNAGLRRAIKQGKRLGRPVKEVSLETIKSLFAHKQSYRAVGRELGISRETVKRRLRAVAQIPGGK